MCVQLSTYTREERPWRRKILGSERLVLEALSFSFIALCLTHAGNPRFLNVPRQQNVTENTTGFILCPVDRGYPEASVRWCKNGQTVVSGPRMNVTSEGLQITDVKPEDAGNYTCSLFRDAWGSIFTTVRVQVLSGNTGGEYIAVFDDNWSIQLKCRQVLFQAQVSNR